MKVTIIGAGNMGGALARGMAKSKAIGAASITVSDPNPVVQKKLKEQFPEMNVTADNNSAVKDSDVVIIAVKPWMVEKVVPGLRNCLDYSKQIVVSIAAGVGLDQLSSLFFKSTGKIPPIFYAIPNIAAEYGEGMTFISAADGVSDEQRQQVLALFKEVGDAMLCDERLIAPGMVISSCGIAYVMRYVRAMQEGGVEMGFYPSEALKIVCQTMIGAVKLLDETGMHPEDAIDKVTTPGGYAIKGLNELDNCGFNAAVVKGLKAGLK